MYGGASGDRGRCQPEDEGSVFPDRHTEPGGDGGTYPLPEAQIEPVCHALSMGYPTMEEELAIIDRYKSDDPLAQLEPVCTCEDILQLQELCRRIYVSDSVKKYLVQIIQATREHDGLRWESIREEHCPTCIVCRRMQ